MFSKKILSIKKFIQEDRLKNSFIEANDLLSLLEHMDSVNFSLIKDYQNEIALLANRTKRVQNDEKSNTKSSEGISIEKNNIIRSFLHLLTELEELIYNIQNSLNKGKVREFSNKISDMEYLIYFSKSKMNMLRFQFYEEKKLNDNRSKTLKAVIDRLDDYNLIGNLHDSKPYIYGEMEMLWGVLMGRSSIFFTNNTSSNIFLFGSSYHLLGEKRKRSKFPSDRYGHSIIYRFNNLLHKIEQDNFVDFKGDYNELTNPYNRITRLTSQLDRDKDINGYTKEKLKFVARKYKSIQKPGKELIIGSPIFISLPNE